VRALHGAGYLTLSDLAGVSRSELAALHGFGPKGQARLDQVLAEAGLGMSAGITPIESPLA
jgi:hypothetical protein